MKFGKRLHRASMSFADPAYAVHLLDYKALKKIIKQLATRPHFLQHDATSITASIANTSPSLSSLSSTTSSPADGKRRIPNGAHSAVLQLNDDLSRELSELSTAGRAVSASAVRDAADSAASQDAPSSNSSSASTASNSSLSIQIPSHHCGLTSIDSPNSSVSTPSASPTPSSPRHASLALSSPLSDLEYNHIAREFIAALEAEMNKINAFYNRVVLSMTDDVKLLRTVSDREGDLSSLSDLCENLNQLRKFIVLNYLGVIKIVKKHDKNAPHPVADRMIPLLYAQPFYHSLQVAALYSEIDSLSRRGLKAVSRDDYTCPLCNDLLECPVVLSCSHRFCWKCLSQAAISTSEHEACPVCRKPQLLDPSNYLVDDLLLKFIRANFPKKGNGDQRQLSSTSAPSAVELHNGDSHGDTRTAGMKIVTEEQGNSSGLLRSGSSFYQPSTAASYSSTAGASMSDSFSSSSSSSAATPALPAEWSDGHGLVYSSRRRRSDASHSAHEYPNGPHVHSASSYRYHPYNDYSVAAAHHPPYSAPALPIASHYAPAFIHPSQRQAQLDAERHMYQQQMEEHMQQQQQQNHEQQLQQNLQMHLQQHIQNQQQQQQPPHQPSLLGSPTLPPSALELSPLLTSVSPNFASTPPPGHTDLLELPSAAHASASHNRLPIRPWQSQEGTGDKFLLPWLPEDEEDEDVCAEPTIDPVNIGYHWPHFHEYAADVEQQHLDRQVMNPNHTNGHGHAHRTDAVATIHDNGEDYDMRNGDAENSEHLTVSTSPLSANSVASSLSSHDSFSSANMPLLSLTSMNHLLIHEEGLDEHMNQQASGDQSPPLPPIESGNADGSTQLLSQPPQLMANAYGSSQQPDSQPTATPPPRPTSVDHASLDEHMDQLQANLAAAMSRQPPQLPMMPLAVSAAPAMPYAQAIVVAEPQPHSAYSRRSHPRSDSFHSEASASSTGSHSMPSPASQLSHAMHAPPSDFHHQPLPSGDYHYVPCPPTAVVAMEVLPYPPPPARPERRDSRGNVTPISLPASPHSAVVGPASFVVPPPPNHPSSSRFKHPSAISTQAAMSAPYLSASAPSSPLTSEYSSRPLLSVNPSASPVGRSHMTSPSSESVASSMSSPAARSLPGGRVTPVVQKAIAPMLPRAASYTAVATAASYAHSDDQHDASSEPGGSHYGLSVQIPHSSTASPQPHSLPPLPRAYTPTHPMPASLMSSTTVWMPVVAQQLQQTQTPRSGRNGEEKESPPDGDVPYTNLSPTSTASSGAASMSALMLNSSSDNLSSTTSSPTASSPQSGSSYLALAQEVPPATPREAALLRFTSTRMAPKFICDHPGCNDGFNTRFSLKRHLKTHSGEKPFQCDKCPKMFAEKSTLIRHLRIHTGEKPFRCSVDGCTRSFSDRTNVRRHEQQHELQKDLPMEEQTAWMSEEVEREVLKKREVEAKRRAQMAAIMGVKVEDVTGLVGDMLGGQPVDDQLTNGDEPASELHEPLQTGEEDTDLLPSNTPLPLHDPPPRYVKLEEEEVKMDSSADV